MKRLVNGLLTAADKRGRKEKSPTNSGQFSAEMKPSFAYSSVSQLELPTPMGASRFCHFDAYIFNDNGRLTILLLLQRCQSKSAKCTVPLGEG